MEADPSRLAAKLKNAVVIDFAAAKLARDNAPRTATPYNDPAHITMAMIFAMIALVFFLFVAHK